MGTWLAQAHRLRREAHTLALACQDPRMPWCVKALAAGLVAYALSPIDLIPDFIPVLGYLDDLVVIPLGVLLIRRWIPADVWADCRARAETLTAKPVSRVGAAIVVVLWLLATGLAVWLILHVLDSVEPVWRQGRTINVVGYTMSPPRWERERWQPRSR